MEKTNFSALRVGNIRPCILTDEQRRQGRKIMENIFVGLLCADDGERMNWTGTQTDLVELAYVAYLGGVVREGDGSPATFASLVRRIFRKLNAREPYNLYNMAARARRRKGMRRHTLTERFCWQKFVAGVDNPLSEEIKRMA